MRRSSLASWLGMGMLVAAAKANDGDGGPRASRERTRERGRGRMRCPGDRGGTAELIRGTGEAGEQGGGVARRARVRCLPPLPTGRGR